MSIKYGNKINFLSSHSIAYKLIESKSKILSIGCGQAFVENLLQKNKNCLVQGIDIIHKRFVKIKNYQRRDLNTLKFKKLNFDYVLLLDILEHLDSPEKFLKRIKDNILHKKNILIISVPNIANIAIRLMLLFGKFNYTERGILDKTHKKFYTLDSIKKTITKEGFFVKKVYYIPIPFPLFVKNQYLSVMLMYIYNIFTQFFGSLFSYQFLLIVRKK